MSDVLTSSGLKTSSGVIAARNAKVASIQVVTNGVANATVIIYDNASAASGTVLAKLIIAGASHSGSWSHDTGVEGSNGLYLSISGTGAEAVIHYSLL